MNPASNANDPASNPGTPPAAEGEVPHGGLGFELPPPAHFSVARAVALLLIIVLLTGGAFTVGYLPRRSARIALAQHNEAVHDAPLRVETVTPHVGASSRSLSLPGSVQPLETTVVYARASGYLRSWRVDIGDVVHVDQTLAEIETPELDQEILQARAQLGQAEAGVPLANANLTFARTDLARYTGLAPSGFASRSDVEQRTATAAVAEANLGVARAAVGAARANLQRLQQLKSFARVTAPFAGTVTTRAVDRGALVTAGTTALFTVAATDPARVFVQVPQDVAPSVTPGLTARVSVREYPGAGFEGHVTRTSASLDPTSRTLNTEIRVPNPDGRILAGMYAEVALTLPTPHRVYELPATTVLSDASGLRVAVVDADNTIHLVPVVVERDTGAVVQIARGLTGDEQIARVANPALIEGTRVEVVHPAPTAAGAH